MKFVTIEPAETRVTGVEADNLFDLYPQLGLARIHVDHAIVVPVHRLPSGAGIAIVVGEFSLFNSQHWFAIGSRLYGGSALLYSYDESGETVDMEHVPQVVFMTVAGIEKAIADGHIDRPTMSINGEQIWQWPEPSPFENAS